MTATRPQTLRAARFVARSAEPVRAAPIPDHMQPTLFGFYCPAWVWGAVPCAVALVRVLCGWWPK